jgi:hypothetical protein
MIRTLVLLFVSLAICHVSHAQDNDSPSEVINQSVEVNTTTEVAPAETVIEESNHRSIDDLLRDAAHTFETADASEQVTGDYSGISESMQQSQLHR